MKPAEVMVKTLLSAMLLFIIWITGYVLWNAGVKPYLVITWALIVLLFGLSAGSVLQLLPKSWAPTLFIAAIIVTVIAALLQLKVIPICGDDVCAAGECSRCAADCTPNDCQDGTCQPATERCDTSSDCACVAGTACAPGRQNTTADVRGCVPTKCGDGYCDAGETAQTCCTDCGCTAGYTCERNICFYQVPKVTFVAQQAAPAVSALSLAGNPLLTDARGNTRPLMRIGLRSSQSIENITARFVIPDMLDNSIRVNAIYAEQEAEIDWYVHPDPRLLDVKADTPTNIVVFLTYYDALRNKYQMNRSFPITIRSSRTLDSFGHIVLFTQEVQTQSRTPQGIWDELRRNVTVQVRKDNTVQFPHETLRIGTGASQDIAVLLASAYNTAGLRTYLVDTQQGFFVRVWDKDRFVMLDPSMFDGPFDKAISFQPGSGVYGINQTMIARNFTQIDIS